MKAKTDLYCPDCGTKVWKQGDELPHLAPFTGTEHCCNECDAILRRRSPGGQSDAWNFVVYDATNEKLRKLIDNAVTL